MSRAACCTGGASVDQISEFLLDFFVGSDLEAKPSQTPGRIPSNQGSLLRDPSPERRRFYRDQGSADHEAFADDFESRMARRTQERQQANGNGCYQPNWGVPMCSAATVL